MHRRTFLQSLATVGIGVRSTHSNAGDSAATIATRPIPSSGEPLPVIGLGTWQTFDVGDDASVNAQLREVLEILVAAGGSVVDSSPMYGRSEEVVGRLAEQAGIAEQLFFATKVWTRGRETGISEMNRSMSRMGAEPMDLMQIHNLVDADTHMETLSRWKEQGKIRYTGITHYHSGGYPGMVRLMQDYPMDFIQVNYSLLSTDAEREVLPLAREKGIAVLVNRPYEGGRLFAKVSGLELPGWAIELGCRSWGQFFLKFILANEAVTCVIPGTSKVRHMRDNLAAGIGPIPGKEEAEKMANHIRNL